MAREELAGYMILAALAVGAIRVFGFARVMAAIAGIVLLVMTIAFQTVRASSRRRYQARLRYKEAVRQ